MAVRRVGWVLRVARQAGRLVLWRVLAMAAAPGSRHMRTWDALLSGAEHRGQAELL